MLEPTPIGTDPYWTRLITRLEALYIGILPLLGAWAAILVDRELLGWVVGGGWLLAVINLTIHVPMVISGYQQSRKMRWLWLPLLPMGLLATRQGLIGGSAWGFFLDDVMLESCSLMLGFIGMLLVGTGVSGKSAFKDLGCFTVFLVIGFLLGAIGGFVIAWVQTLHGQPWWSILGLVFAFFLGIAGKIWLLMDIAGGAFDADAHMQGKEWMIIVMIFTWLFGLPLAVNLLM